MRLLVVINALGEGGTEMSTAELLPHLREHGVDPHVVLLRSRGTEGVEQRVRDDGFPLHILPPGARARTLAFRTLQDQIAPDVVHSALFEANLLARLGRRRPTPLVTSLVITSYAPERFEAAGPHAWKLRTTQLLDAATSPFTTHFHAVSEAVADDAHRRLRIKREKITVVHRGRRDLRREVPEGAGDRVRAELGIAPTATIVLNVARHEPQKDHLTLLDAADRLLPADPDLHVVLAGREGTTTEVINRRVAQMPHRSRVHVLGHRGDVPALLDAADVFVLTSRYEGLPGAVLEAMAMGLPVVASDIGPVTEALGPGRRPSAGNAADLTQHLIRLLGAPERRVSEAQANRERFLELFTIAGSAVGMLGLFERVVHTDVDGSPRPWPVGGRLLERLRGVRP